MRIQMIFHLLVCGVTIATSLHVPVRAAEVSDFDIVIYGGTSAAVTAAVQAARMGKTVVVVSPDRHLGGLSSGGLGVDRHRE